MHTMGWRRSDPMGSDGVAMARNWYLKSVIGPDGRRLTLADLPPIDLKRWYPQHKACIATAVRKGLISAEEVCKRYRLTMEEIQIWERALHGGGVKGLRVSGKNLSRSAHSHGATHPAPQKAHYLKFGEALNACLGLGCGLKVLITFDGKPRKCTTERLTAQLQSRFEGSKPPDEETVKKWRQGRRLPTTANFKRLIAVLRTESVFSTNSDPKASEEHIKAARLDAIAHLEAVYGRYCDPSERILEGHDRIACPDRASESDRVLSPSSVAQPVSVTIAVLPFVNFSEDLAQEFFCDGMTEEIAAALAKVPDLHVVGRSSAFQFKGAGKDLRAVGQALSARYLIDGSVRKAKGRVRISAQLIDVGNGTQLWSEIYEREIKDVFAVQEEIAQAIAASLRVPLGLDEGEFLVHTWTAHLDSYEDYLRARALLRAGAGPPICSNG
jgi:TolB-like protein